MPDAQFPPADQQLRLRLCAASLAGTLSALALFGWVFDREVLASLAPGFTAMDPDAATALLLASLALVLPLRQILLVRILAGIVLAVGVAKLALLSNGSSAGTELLLFPAQGIAPDRAPVTTAMALIWLGTALFVRLSRHRLAAVSMQILGLVVFAIALLALVNYLLNFVALHQTQMHSSMALNTAVSLAALGVAVIGINRDCGFMRLLGDRGPAGTVARTALPFALLVPILIGLVQLFGQRAGLYGTEDGVVIHVFADIMVTCTLLAVFIVILFRSDKARRDREVAMALSESRYRHAEQVGHIGHWRIEFSSGTVEWSDETYAIWGVPKGTVPSLEMNFAMCHPDDRDGPVEVIKQAIKDCGEWDVAHRIIRPDGEVRYVQSHGLCERDGRGDVAACFGVHVDITDLELARREAEAATVSQAAFLAHMSHEIRTPMNGVMGFVELLMDSKLDAKQRRHLQLVRESAQALLKLLNDILDLSKIDAGRLDLNAEPSNVRHDIKQCVRLLTPSAEQKGLTLKATFADGFPDHVLIDSLRFRQILFNLLGNAIKFTSRGSVSVALGEVLRPGGKRFIQATVADTGVGIADDRKAAIFDAFVQADASVSRQFGGSGLGLSISRRLVGLMGGTITLESEQNEGTLVTLTLPLDEVFAPALTPVGRARGRRTAITDGERTMRQQASILLVEDVDINRELITEMLNRLGHRVDLAKDGAEALVLARRLELEPGAWDLILMDVQMPVMDGLTATRAIRALGDRAATIPIIALTANAFATEMQDCRDAGMDDHIVKPSGFAELKEAVEHWSDIAQSPMPPIGFAALGTASIADRFQTRLRQSTERLVELTAELSTADEEGAMALMREAAGIAHVLAGTAGMFGRAPLGKIAKQVEHELRANADDESIGRASRAAPPIGRLIAALATAPKRSASPVRARAA